jgi:hypothetical protein
MVNWGYWPLTAVDMVSPQVIPLYLLTRIGRTWTEISSSRETDLSLSTLLGDMLGVVQHMFPDPKESPSFVVSSHMRTVLDGADRPSC